MRSIRCLLVLCAAAFALAPACAWALTFEGNTECRVCHADVASGAPIVDFGASAVDFSRCRKCHWPARHWGHGVGVQCNTPDCHVGFPTRTVFWYSDTYTAYGYFDNAASILKSPAELHRIHANGSWPKTIAMAIPYCDSCHEPAACDTCHVADPSHGDHTAGANPSVAYRVAPGVANMYTCTAYTDVSSCVNPACHSLAAAAAGAGFEPQCSGCHDVQASHHLLHDAGASLSPGCRKCHSSYVDDEHLRRGMQCAVCHGDEVASGVMAAVDAGDTSCAACHGAVFHYQKVR